LHHSIKFFRTAPTPCPYLPGKMERKLFTSLGGSNAIALHDRLSEIGFRRSHRLAHRPRCDECNECVPVRVRVQDFKTTRSMRRTLAANKGIEASVLPALASKEHFHLFQHYQLKRHRTGDMAKMKITDYKSMVEDTSVNTFLVEYRNSAEQLYAICLSDKLTDGLSLVYSFFDPDKKTSSLGTFLILWHIEKAREMGLQYIYLGHWVSSSKKMAYKRKFQPLEAYIRGHWSPL